MTLISSDIKTNIILKLNDIVNIEDPEWSNLGIDLKLKIVHNLCNFLKKNVDSTQQIQQIQQMIPINNIIIGSMELCGINKQMNSELFNEFRKEQVLINKEFRKTYNSKNKNYCFANLSSIKYNSIINNYNLNIYNFMNKNINIINSKKLYNNLLMGNQQKLITDKNIQDLKINKITYIDQFLNIEFNNNILIKLELYFTSEKITSNIPAKYKIFLTNIF